MYRERDDRERLIEQNLSLSEENTALRALLKQGRPTTRYAFAVFISLALIVATASSCAEALCRLGTAGVQLAFVWFLWSRTTPTPP